MGRRVYPRYAHPCSPKTYTQPQLFACLAVKKFQRIGYQATNTRLKEWPALCRALGLPEGRVPSAGALWNADRRLLKKGARND